MKPYCEYVKKLSNVFIIFFLIVADIGTPNVFQLTQNDNYSQKIEKKTSKSAPKNGFY